MNYYERHLGDYAKDTTHLSMLEHGAYTLLMDRYYGTERPIPEDQVYRVTRAHTKEERKAVDAVLGEFFTLVQSDWNQGRINAEIAKMQSKVKAAQENGRRGGRPKKNQDETRKKPTGFPLGSENETQQKALQSPVTSHQTPNTPTDVGVAPEMPAPGLVCKVMKQAGLADVNPSHPKLAALLAAGVTAAELVDAARSAVGAGKSFAYALATAEGRRRDAEKVTPLPTKAVGKHAGFEQLDYSKGVNPDGSLAV